MHISYAHMALGTICAAAGAAIQWNKNVGAKLSYKTQKFIRNMRMLPFSISHVKHNILQ